MPNFWIMSTFAQAQASPTPFDFVQYGALGIVAFVVVAFIRSNSRQLDRIDKQNELLAAMTEKVGAFAVAVDRVGTQLETHDEHAQELAGGLGNQIKTQNELLSTLIRQNEANDRVIESNIQATTALLKTVEQCQEHFAKDTKRRR